MIFVQDSDFTLYVGDVRDVLKTLPAESVDCIVTSPPYWGLRDYGATGQLGLEPTPEEYVANMVEVFREVRRVLRADGTCWVNLGDSYASSGGQGEEGSSDGDTGRGPRGPRIRAGLKPKDLVGIPWLVARALQEPYYMGEIRDERERIWLAAMVEAEGCLYIHKRKVGQSNGQGYERKNATYGAGLEVASTDRVIAERCLAIAGKGSICEQSEGRRQTIYRWTLRSNECRSIIRELYPHFVAKHHEARLLLGCPSSGDKAEAAHESLKALHNGGEATIDFPAPDLLYEPGWYLRADIVWSKSNPMPESVTDRPTKAHEYVFLLTKSPRYFFDQEAVREPGHNWGPRDRSNAKHNTEGFRAAGQPPHTGLTNGDATAGRNIRSVWEIGTQPFSEAHFATYPEALVERCLKAGCSEGGTALDPFLGSGTTALVARRLGRKCIGIELNPTYAELAAKRLSQLSLLA